MPARTSEIREQKKRSKRFLPWRMSSVEYPQSKRLNEINLTSCPVWLHDPLDSEEVIT